MGMPIQVTLTSTGPGRAVNLDWMSGKFTSYAINGSSSGTFAWTLAGTLDDLNQTAVAAVVWTTLSSGTANSSLSIYPGPLGGLRLTADSLSSAALTLRILQGIGQ